MVSIIGQSALFIWFIFSIYLVAIDPHLTSLLRMIGQAINLLSMAFIATNMVLEDQPKNKKQPYSNSVNETAFVILYVSINSILLAWYIYYTPIDFKANYKLAEKIMFCTVDISMIIYLLTTLLGMLLLKVILQKLNIVNQIIECRQLGFRWF